MDWKERAREVAMSLRMLNGTGELRSLGSLEIIDYVIELEQVTGLEIPSARATAEHFVSLTSVGAMLALLADEQATR